MWVNQSRLLFAHRWRLAAAEVAIFVLRYIKTKQSLYRLWWCQGDEDPRLPDNLQMKVLRISALCTCRVYPFTHFCWGLSRPQGHSETGRIKWIKILSDTIRNRTRDLQACSAVPQLTAPPRTHITICGTYELLIKLYIWIRSHILINCCLPWYVLWCTTGTHRRLFVLKHLLLTVCM